MGVGPIEVRLIAVGRVVPAHLWRRSEMAGFIPIGRRKTKADFVPMSMLEWATAQGLSDATCQACDDGTTECGECGESRECPECEGEGWPADLVEDYEEQIQRDEEAWEQHHAFLEGHSSNPEI